MPKILIVDDEPNVRFALRRWFELAGFDVEEADDGVKAVAMCETTTFDVITMDLEMPHMDGIEATRRIRQAHPDVPIIILTGFHAHPDQVAAVGASCVLNKPLSMRDLEKSVREVLQAAEGGPERSA